MHRILTSSLLALVAVAASAQECRQVKVGDIQNPGITYSLPSTHVRMTVKASCTETKAGIYAQYAERFLGITDAPQEDAVVWSFEGISLEPYALADPDRTCHIEINDKSQPVDFYLTADENLLLGVNQRPKPAAAKPVAPEAEAEEAPAASIAVNIMNEDLLKAGTKAKQAEVAAKQIFRIRESRLNLLTGDVDNMPADGASFQLILSNLEAQEKAYMALFVGERVTTSTEREYTYKPFESTDNQVLFRFSRHYGFVDADDLSGEAYSLTVRILDDRREVPVIMEKGKVKPAATGVAYIVPGKVSISVNHKHQTLLSTDLQVAQLGHVEHLPLGQFTNKKQPCSALLHPITGAIQLMQK